MQCGQTSVGNKTIGRGVAFVKLQRNKRPEVVKMMINYIYLTSLCWGSYGSYWGLTFFWFFPRANVPNVSKTTRIFYTIQDMSLI